LKYQTETNLNEADAGDRDGVVGNDVKNDRKTIKAKDKKRTPFYPMQPVAV
jgi:hypothetical protein